jgi:hypothetical protein
MKKSNFLDERKSKNENEEKAKYITGKRLSM